MAIPLLIPAVIGLTGMFVGSQIDDAIEAPKQGSQVSGLFGFNATTLILLGVGAYFLLNKTKR